MPTNLGCGVINVASISDISEEMLNDDNELEDERSTIANTFFGIKERNIQHDFHLSLSYLPIIPNTYLFLCFSFLLLIINPPKKHIRVIVEQTVADYEVSALKIRKCYRDLLSVVFDESINKLRITGNPSIGKTFFGYYLLYQLALQDATVVYDNYNETDPIVFEGEKGAFTSYSISIKTYLQNKDVWYIVDGKEPKNVNAKTILICSSRREHYKHFDEYSGTVAIRYMPTWSWKEIKSCRQVLYEDRVTPELAKDLYSKWELNEAIKGSKGDIFDDIGESCIERSKFSHMIVHINVNHPVENDNKDENGKIPYTIVTIKFASDYVKEQVTDQLEERIRERLLEQTKQA
ncbi:unnamed protein product [Rhizophagus irregularis]|nr:unnamed protein product [Rhizophagus irregularis]